MVDKGQRWSDLWYCLQWQIKCMMKFTLPLHALYSLLSSCGLLQWVSPWRPQIEQELFSPKQSTLIVSESYRYDIISCSNLWLFPDIFVTWRLTLINGILIVSFQRPCDPEVISIQQMATISSLADSLLKIDVFVKTIADHDGSSHNRGTDTADGKSKWMSECPDRC